jgi:hypothetical protein
LIQLFTCKCHFVGYRYRYHLFKILNLERIRIVRPRKYLYRNWTLTIGL